MVTAAVYWDLEEAEVFSYHRFTAKTCYIFIGRTDNKRTSFSSFTYQHRAGVRTFT
jgi:hypothetical protein